MYLRQPLKAIRGMNKIKTLIWEKPAIERTRNPREVAWTNSSFHFIIQFLFEAVKGSEDAVEVISREIIQKHLVFGRFMVQLSAKLFDSFDEFRNDKESVWSRRATQICNCQAFGECAAIEASYGFLSYGLCQTNHLLLYITSDTE